MRFNKTALAFAVAAALGSGSALATVDLDGAAGNTGPLNYASEIIVNPGVTALLPPGGGVGNVTVTLGVAVAAAQNVFARFDLDNGARFAGIPTLAPGVLVAGGAATSFVIFQIPGPLPANAPLLMTPVGGITVANSQPVNIRYRLYGNQGNAQDQVGTPNKDASGGYALFADSYSLTVETPTPTSTADAGATPSFTRFVGNNPTTRLGGYTIRLNTPNQNNTFAAYQVGGVPWPNLGVLLAGATTLTVGGDFTASAAANAVQRTAAACPGGTTANPLTDTLATFGALPLGGIGVLTESVCYTVDGTTAIPPSDYTVTLNAVSATPAAYAARSIGPLALGRIVRNGTTLIAPFVQVPTTTPTSSTTRLIVTNSGSVEYTYALAALPADGSTVTLAPAVATGSVPANSTKVVDLTGQITLTPTGNSTARTGLRLTAPAPVGAITAYYQFYNPNTKVPSNFILEPGL